MTVCTKRRLMGGASGHRADLRQDAVVKAWWRSRRAVKAWWRSRRAAVASGRVQRGILYAMAVGTLVVAVLVSRFPQWGGEVSTATGRFVARFWPGLLLVVVAWLLASTAWTGGRRVNARRRLPPLLVHVALMLGLATAVAVGAGALLWTTVGRPALRGVPVPPIPVTSATPEAAAPQWTLTNTFDAMKIVLSVVAGIGGVIALTVAYRRQHLGEAAEQREDTKLFTDRFGRAAELLGSSDAGVRLAGVYAMAALADDWLEGRQTCIDVLCALLRMPYTAPLPRDDIPDALPTKGSSGNKLVGSSAGWPWHQARRQGERPSSSRVAPNALATAAQPARDPQEERQVRHTVIRLVRDHLRLPADHEHSWQDCDFDFTGAVFDGGDLSRAHFAGARVSFRGARFSGGRVFFRHATFSGGKADFAYATFSGSVVDFGYTTFSGCTVNFGRTTFSGGSVDFSFATFSGGKVDFSDAMFSGGTVDFSCANFTGAGVYFVSAGFSGGTVSFFDVNFSAGVVSFTMAIFSGGTTRFTDARFSGGDVSFSATFSGGTVAFRDNEFRGAEVDFRGASFSGGTVDLSVQKTWTIPPVFDPFPYGPPTGLRLPRNMDSGSGPESCGRI